VSPQIITPAEVLSLTGKTGMDYVLDRPPHTRYRWNGAQMVPLLAGAYRSSGTSAAPVNTLTNAVGAFGLPQIMKIPANAIVPGKTRAKLRVQVSKSGSDLAYLQVHFGPNNGLTDPNILAGAAPQFTSLASSEWLLDIDITFTAARLKAVWTRASLSVGWSAGFANETTGLDFAVDNYINLVISNNTGLSTFNLLGHNFELF
jgi:hypothetical protein